MTIQTHQGDLFSQSGIIVHGCNCQGAMGSGVAGQLRAKYPFAFKAYEHRHEIFGLQLGDIVAVAHPEMRTRFPTLSRYVSDFDESIPMGDIVVNAMTQYFYGRDKSKLYVDYLAIEAAFARVRMLALVTGMEPNFPLIGCGLANGTWDIAGLRVERGLADVTGHLWQPKVDSLAVSAAPQQSLL